MHTVSGSTQFSLVPNKVTRRRGRAHVHTLHSLTIQELFSVLIPYIQVRHIKRCAVVVLISSLTIRNKSSTSHPFLLLASSHSIQNSLLVLFQAISLYEAYIHSNPRLLSYSTLVGLPIRSKEVGIWQRTALLCNALLSATTVKMTVCLRACILRFRS